MIRLKLFTPEDHPEISKWWEANGWPVVGLEVLPEIGLIAYDDVTNVNLSAGWLYVVTHYWAWAEWFVVNPKAPARSRKLGLELILDKIIIEAKALNAKAIVSSLKSKGLIRLYERHGFQRTDIGMTNMLLNCSSVKVRTAFQEKEERGA